MSPFETENDLPEDGPIQEPQQTSDPAELSMDDFFSMEVDQAGVEETLRKGLLPNGTYRTDPDEFGDMNAYPRLMEEKDDQGTVIGTRRVIRLTGRGKAKVKIKKELVQIDGRLEVELSPDYRDKRDFETGEILDVPDSRSKLWAQAVRAFETHYQEKAKNAGQVVAYLTKVPVRFRMGQIGVATEKNPNPTGEPRNFCFSITADRPGRG